MAVKIDIEKIEIPQGLLPRLFGVNEDTVEEYMNAIQMGEKFPPIEVWTKDNGVYWIVDGVHRYTAYKRLGHKQVEAKVLAISDLTDFIELATLANLKHGLQLTKDDKRHVARMLYSRGKNLKQIEKLLKVPERTLYRWTEDLRDEQERKKEKQKQEAIRLYNEGYTQQEIADLLGTTQQTISNWINESLQNSAKWQKFVKDETAPQSPGSNPENEPQTPEESQSEAEPDWSDWNEEEPKIVEVKEKPKKEKKEQDPDELFKALDEHITYNICIMLDRFEEEETLEYLEKLKEDIVTGQFKRWSGYAYAFAEGKLKRL